MPADLKLLPGLLSDKGSDEKKIPPSSAQIEDTLHKTVQELVESAKQDSESTFMAFESELFKKVQLLGRLLLTLFLCVREERERARTPARVIKEQRSFTLRPVQQRTLNTLFGVVSYFRSYLRGSDGHGYHPLDVQLGLTTDRLSMNVLSIASRLATMMSYARVKTTLSWFLGAAPSTEVIEQTVLGLGRRTQQWFEQAPAPEEDGEVLCIQIDGKGAPTATDTELMRRRGPRRPNPHPESARHRGRHKRAQYGKKPRRKKGDKSKNARMATIVVMYTLKRSPDGRTLLGPINRRVYASFAPKRHAFAIARREANKRGFTPDSGKLVQLITDGDDDLTLYAKQTFPEAIHTVDIMHVIQYLYKAGECLHKEGTPELEQFVSELKELLYNGKETQLVAQLQERLAEVPRTGPGNKGRRERLYTAIRYVEKRVPQMNYQSLREQDLELGSGIVEGAAKNLVGARFDFGGSRWIRERAEALLQLRCIEQNGDWDRFIQWVHDDHRQRGQTSGERIRVQHKAPGPLPVLRLAA